MKIIRSELEQFRSPSKYNISGRALAGKSSGSTSRYEVVIDNIQRTAQRQNQLTTIENGQKALRPVDAIRRQAPSFKRIPFLSVTSEPAFASARFIAQQIAQQEQPTERSLPQHAFLPAVRSYDRTLELTAVVPGLQGVSERLA